MDSKKKLIFALVIGAVASLATNMYIDSELGSLSQGKRIEVVRAKSPIPAGTVVSSRHLGKAQVPEKWVPREAVAWGEREQIIGQETSVDIPSNDYVLHAYFGVRQSLANKLSGLIKGEGALRAINLPVDETNSLANSIVAGDKIDITLTFAMPGLPQSMSTVLLQSVPVIATGGYSVADREMGARGGRTRRYNSLTLLLPPNDSIRLIYARQAGKINILLRNESDQEIIEFPAVSSIADILSPSDKTAIEVAVKNIQTTVSADEDKVRAQLKELFEQRKSQAGR